MTLNLHDWKWTKKTTKWSGVNKQRQERKYERQERPNERLNYINNIKTRMTELTTINQSTPINYINNGETARSDNEVNIVSVTILRGTTDAVDKKPSNQIQKYKHEQLRCKKQSFSILNYRRDWQKTRLQQIQDIWKLYIKDGISKQWLLSFVSDYHY